MEGIIAGMNFCAFCNCTSKETFFSQNFCSNLYCEKNSIVFLTPNFVIQYIHIYKFCLERFFQYMCQHIYIYIYIYVSACVLQFDVVEFISPSLSPSLSLSHTHTLLKPPITME